MNKKDLIAYVAEKTEISKKDAQTMVEATFEGISEALRNEEKVSIPGFGSFEVKERKEREGQNPTTKEKMIFPASKSVKFKNGKTLKESLKK